MNARGPRRRRWPRVLGILIALSAMVVLALAYYLRPARLTGMILTSAGRSLRLQLGTSGSGRFSLWPEPHLTLPGMSASLPGAATPFFHAAAFDVALPWDTLRGRSSDVSSVTLKSPDVDLPMLKKWLATLPPSTAPFKFPSLTHGMHVDDATVHDGPLSIQHLDVALYSLADGAPMKLDASGQVVSGSVTSKFAMAVAATPAGVGRGMRIADSHVVLKSDGELPSFTADGNVLLADTIDVDLHGSFQRLPTAWSDATDTSFAAPGDTPFSIALSKKPPPPHAGFSLTSLTAGHGYELHVAVGDPKRQLTLALDATATTGAMLDASTRVQISHWPDAWHDPPPAVAPGTSPIAFDASYKGPAIMTSAFAYDLRTGDRNLRGQFSLADLNAWIAQESKALLHPSGDAPAPPNPPPLPDVVPKQ